ncbi:MAG: YdeI/OmpD-associated family protein [Candidatus Saccharimonadales bacterium]
MTSSELSHGVVHKVPADLRTVLISSAKVKVAWEDITPLARNEWICWIEDAKKPETRRRRIKRTHEELIAGKRRPCCWAGCIHRQK